MIADIEMIQRRLQCLNKFGVAMAKIVGAAIEMQVDEAASRHVIKAVAFAPVYDQINADRLPELGLVRVPELDRLIEQLLLRFKLEMAVVKHGEIQKRRSMATLAKAITTVRTRQI